MLPPARVVEVVAGEARQPVVEHPDQRAGGDVRAHQLLGDIGQPEAGQRGGQHLVAAVEGELAVDLHRDLAAVLLQLPGVEAAVGHQPQVDAGVVAQRRGVARRRPAGQVGRRTDDRHPQVGADPDRDHVLGHLLAAPHPGVEAPGDDVGQAVVGDELDADVGILRQEPRQLRPEQVVDRVVGRGDADGAGRLVAQLGERGELGLDLVEPRPDGAQQPLPGLGRRDAAGGPRQEPEADLLLETADRVADRRGRDPERRRGAGEAPLAGGGAEGDQAVQALARHW